MHTLFMQLIFVGPEGFNICIQVPESNLELFLLGRLDDYFDGNRTPGGGGVHTPLGFVTTCDNGVFNGGYLCTPHKYFPPYL